MKELMKPSPKVIYSQNMAWDALAIMEENPNTPIMVLPVVDIDTNVVVGILKMHDIIKSGLTG